jgi:hypothetical protein
VRLSAAKFFSPGAGGLVDEAPNPDVLILNCYRLADRFKQNPMVFLQLPVSEINMHIHYSIKLIEAQRDARERGREPDE